MSTPLSLSSVEECYRASYCSYSLQGLAPFGQWTFVTLVQLEQSCYAKANMPLKRQNHACSDSEWLRGVTRVCGARGKKQSGAPYSFVYILLPKCWPLENVRDEKKSHITHVLRWKAQRHFKFMNHGHVYWTSHVFKGAWMTRSHFWPKDLPPLFFFRYWYQ